MYVLFLDHAGATEDPSQSHIILAGISVFERQTFWIAQELDAIASHFNQADPLSVELHGSPMHGGRSEWRRFPVADRIHAISDALAVIAKSHPSNTLFGAAVKKPAIDPGAAIDIAFEQICRLFDRYLKRFHRQGQTHRGIIVFDKATYETEIQSLAIDFRQFGREWVVIHNLCEESWSDEFEQRDKWSFCLSTAKMAVSRRDNEQTTTPEPRAGFQGKSGFGRDQGREDAG